MATGVLWQSEDGKRIQRSSKTGQLEIKESSGTTRPADPTTDAAAIKDYEQNYEAKYGGAEKVDASLGTETYPVASQPGVPSASSFSNKQASSGNSTSGSWVKQNDLFDVWTHNDYSRQELPFMFEVWNPQTNKIEFQAVLPLNPESYRMVYTPRATTTLTQGGIYEDIIGQAPPKFTMSGVFGVVGTTLVGAGKSLDNSGHTGMYLYHEIEKALLEFYERFGSSTMDGNENKKRVDMKTPIELRFYNFCDQEYWQVQINQFSLQRSLQRRHLYQYDIQMTGVKRLLENREDDIMGSMSNIPAANETEEKLGMWDKFIKNLQGSVNEITGPMKTATAAMAKVTAEVDKLKGVMGQISGAVANFKNGATDLVHTPANLIKTALEATKSINQSVVDIANLPHEFINDMRETQRLLQTYYSNRNLFSSPLIATTTSAPATAQESAITKQEIMSINLTNAVKEKTGVITMDIPEETIFADGIENTILVASRTQNISDGDSLQSIAQANGVNWKQVASLNGIEYPYIVRSAYETLTEAIATATTASLIYKGSTTIPSSVVPVTAGNVITFDQGETVYSVKSVTDGMIVLEEPIEAIIPLGTIVTAHRKKLAVLMHGDQILIPGTGRNINIGEADNDVAAKLYGIDEYLDGAGQNVPDINGDVSSISGMSNLEMQLKHRITTQRGELAELGHPSYGSLVPTFIGKANSPVWQERIMVECMIAVMADPRVASISNSRFEIDNDSVFFTADVQPINQMQPLQISIPIA